ncbi:MAG: NADH-quinone oxidoreductase subunit L [Verrucomicrobia bacterium]|nr:NADH-quinone oxidoreductase subunit L [Verrucomicrobiota bacterium]
MHLSTVAWITLVVPLLAAALILLVTRTSKPLAAGIAILSALITCVGGWTLFVSGASGDFFGFNWIDFGDAFSIPFGLALDPLSRTMLVVVTTIAPIVFIYSLGYMKDEEGYWRYFAGLALFLFSMLGIVLADNLVMMFIFWELVGVSSYILIGHYFRKDSAADAAKQAFLVNRIGDFGFMLGVLLFWVSTGSFKFSGLNDSAGLFIQHPTLLGVACVLIFCGTVGKSAQFPLHVWLPNSMEGPTPVSSLLHAATMVAAGVYLLARIFPILSASPEASEVVAWTGAITALGAGILATQQDDIKGILAYSTISQLGYMVTGAGLAVSAALPMFHLFTHAFFKCLLFLTAGSVILGMHHEQNIWKMGGLKNKMPITFLTYCCGMLALSGCPFFSGHYSKDLIMACSWEHHRGIFWVVVIAAALTPFYMMRQALVVFFGAPRGDHARKAHESPLVMLIPLILLAIPAVIAGYPFVEHTFFHEIGSLAEPDVPSFVSWIFLAAFLIGLGLAFAIYRKVGEKDPIRIPAFENRFYIDDFYFWIVRCIQGGFARLCSFIDRWFIDGILVRGSATVVWTLGFALRFLQAGNLQAYAFFFGAGVVGLIYLLLNVR